MPIARDLGTIEWDAQRIDAAATFIRARLNADFAVTGLPQIEFRIDPTWPREGLSDGNSSEIEPRPDDVIIFFCGGHEFSLL
jgi:hypothetical protein